jgi:hypothetical protein
MGIATYFWIFLEVDQLEVSESVVGAPPYEVQGFGIEHVGASPIEKRTDHQVLVL